MDVLAIDFQRGRVH